MGDWLHIAQQMSSRAVWNGRGLLVLNLVAPTCPRFQPPAGETVFDCQSDWLAPDEGFLRAVPWFAFKGSGACIDGLNKPQHDLGQAKADLSVADGTIGMKPYRKGDR